MPPRLRAVPLALLLALPLASCGSGDARTLTSEGSTALNSGQPAQALAKFDKALAKLDPSDPQYLEAKIGQLRARAHSDPAQAKEGFLALAKSQPVGLEHYRRFVDDLTSAGAYLEAARVLEAGKEAHPEYDKWDEIIQKVGDRAKIADDPEALKALKGLGYMGDD